MNRTSTISQKAVSKVIATILFLLLSVAAQPNAYAQAQAPVYIELNADQLDQLVAPIALDPDPLVAQILTGSTYPDQISAADTWLSQNMNLPPDQRAAGANTMAWDPAVKGLTEFPAVLDMLAKNSAWTSQLGNAYYNQPGDVMNAIQAMRQQAQQSNTLVTTAQQRVVLEAGVIDIVPVDPAVIYVPYYNPWRIWGTLFVSYPGFVVLPPPPGIVVATGLAFDPGISVGTYSGYGWGVTAWAPAWTGGTVLFNQGTYISSSVTVANHGYFGGHDCGAFEHGGRGVPGGFHAAAHAGAARAAASRASYSHSMSSSHSTSISRSTSVSRSTSTSRSMSTSHSKASSRSTASSHSASASRSTAGSHSAYAGRGGNGNHSSASNHNGVRSTHSGGNNYRGASSTHSGAGNYRNTRSGANAHGTSAGQSRTASHSMSNSHSASSGRSASAGRSMSNGRSASSGRTASAGRSMSNGRSASSGRTASAGRSMSAGRSASSGRTASAGRSMSNGRSAPSGRTTSAGRSMSNGRSASSGRTASAGRSMSNGRSASSGRTASAGRSMSAGHSGGGHAAGGKRR